MESTRLLNLKDTKLSDYRDGYAKWRGTQSSAGLHYLPIFQAVEAGKSGSCTVLVDGVDCSEFSSVNPQIWSLVSVDGSKSEKADAPAALQFDICFKRFSTIDSLENILKSVSEVEPNLMPNGLLIFELKLDRQTAGGEIDEALHRWRYVLDTLDLRILAKILVPYSGVNDRHAQANASIPASTYLTIVVCRVFNVESPFIREMRRAIDDVRAVTQSEILQLTLGPPQGMDRPRMADPDLSEIWEMHHTLQAQASTAEAMIASLSETAISAKDAARRLLKTERRVLALRKQTSLFLPITYPWSVFAGLVIALLKKRKERRKKKRITGEVSNELGSLTGTFDKGVVVERRGVLGKDGFSSNPKILILKLDHIGDFFRSLPAIDLLKKAWPTAEITIVCSPTNGDLARASGHFDNVIEFKFSAEMSQEVEKAKLENYAQIKALVTDRYDLAIDLRHDPDTRPLLMFVQAKVKAGFQGVDRHYTPLSISLPEMEAPRGTYKNAHNVHRLMLLSSHVVNTLKGFDPAAILSDLVTSGSYAGPVAGSRYIIIAPGGGTLAKKWSPSKFAALSQKFVHEHGYKIVIVGGKAEAEYSNEILNAVPNESVTDLVGKLSLVDLASVISKADFFVGTDTGATHLSALIGVPTIVVFSGVADHNIWEPLGKSVCIVRKPIACAPCHIARIEECVALHKCMKDIEVEDVYRAFLHISEFDGVVGETQN